MTSPPRASVPDCGPVMVDSTGPLDDVEAAVTALDGAAERPGGREDESVLVAGGAGEVLEAGECDARHGARAVARDRPDRVGGRAYEPIHAGARDQADGDGDRRGDPEHVVAGA